jgi:hypothetical protein
MTFELLFNLLLESLQPPQKKKRNELWKTLFHQRVQVGGEEMDCKLMMEGKAFIYKAWTKEEGQRRNMVERAL